MKEEEKKIIDNIANEARSSIGDFCMNICKAKCCQRGFLLLMNQKETQAIVGNNTEKYLNEKILKRSNNNFLWYDLEKKPCKNLIKEKSFCTIHKNQNKPRVCSDYPIFLVKNFVIFSNTCEAVQEGLLDNYKQKFEILGLKVI
jgi:Fe-S-cluster containining protein